MNLVQRLLPLRPKPVTEPATEKAARLFGKEIIGKNPTKTQRKAGGNVVHYIFGGALGGLYCLIAARHAAITFGWGIPFGLSVAVVADETFVPAFGLSALPSKTPARVHLYSLGSHIVFGTCVEGTRRLFVALLEKAKKRTATRISPAR